MGMVYRYKVKGLKERIERLDEEEVQYGDIIDTDKGVYVFAQTGLGKGMLISLDDFNRRTDDVYDTHMTAGKMRNKIIKNDMYITEVKIYRRGGELILKADGGV